MSTQKDMAALTTAVVLFLTLSTSLAFPQRPLASYNNQVTSQAQPFSPAYSAGNAPFGFYLVPIQGAGRMGSFPQFDSPYNMQRPQYVLLNQENFAQQYNPDQTRMDGQKQEPTTSDANSETSKNGNQNDAAKDSTSNPNPQLPSPINGLSRGPVYVVLNQAPQMGYYDFMNPSYMQQMGAGNENYLARRQPMYQQSAASRIGMENYNNYVPFRPASHYRSHTPMARRSHKPLVDLSYAYPNLFTRQQSYDNDGYDDDEGVVVEATKVRMASGERGGEEKGERVDSEKVEAVEPPAGPSVAQAKPQAIAMAGPGGVAAATPMATAVVGPGGMAVAAPSATAVAGPSGGKPPVAIGSNAALTAAYKAQMKAERKQDQFSAVSLGGRIVAPIGTAQSDGMYSYAI